MAKKIIITGASDGIGAEAARQLHGLGMDIVIVGRSPEKTKKIASELGVPYYLADYAKFSDVRALAESLLTDHPDMNVLINNAGGIMGERTLTSDGHEMTLQINHLSPFLLTNLLLERLVINRASVINTSSAANKLLSDFHMNDLELEHGYKPNKAYGNAKLMNIMFTRELHRRFYDEGLRTAALHPGVVATNFASNTKSLFWLFYHTPLKYPLRSVIISPKKGADTPVWLATTEPDETWTSGEYYYKRKVTKADAKAYDQALASELWDRSLTMTGLSDD